MPSLTVTYGGRTLTIPVTAGWTGTLTPHLHFIAGELGRNAPVEVSEARCAGCGAPAAVLVTKTTTRRVDG